MSFFNGGYGHHGGHGHGGHGHHGGPPIAPRSISSSEMYKGALANFEFGVGDSYGDGGEQQEPTKKRSALDKIGAIFDRIINGDP